MAVLSWFHVDTFFTTVSHMQEQSHGRHDTCEPALLLMSNVSTFSSVIPYHQLIFLFYFPTKY